MAHDFFRADHLTQACVENVDFLVSVGEDLSRALRRADISYDMYAKVKRQRGERVPAR